MSELLFTTAGSVVHSAGSPVSGGSFSITSSPSTKVKAGGNFIYPGPTLSVTFSGGNMAGMVPGSVQGAGVITATAVKVMSPSVGTPVMRDKDSGQLVGTGQPTGGGPPTPVTIPCECSETQTKVKGE